MPVELINILIQLPVVLVFVWYAERMQNQFQSFLREERQERKQSLKEIADELKNLHSAIDEHDEKMVTAIQVMQERTKGRQPARAGD